MWADSGPNPGGQYIFNFDVGPKRSWVLSKASTCGVREASGSASWARRFLRLVGAHIQRDPEVFCGPSGFLEAWGTKAKKPHVFRKIVVF